MSAFEVSVLISALCGILAIIFAAIASVLLRKEGAAQSTVYSAVAALFSALFAISTYVNMTVPEPVILPLNNETKTYTDKIEVTIKSEKSFFLETYYTLDGRDPEEEGKLYEDTITVSESTTVCARNKFLWKWSGIAEKSYKFEEIIPEEEQPEEELPKTLIINVNGQDVEVDRITKIPLGSNYPDIPMEAKMTSIFDTHIDKENHIGADIVSDPFISPIDDIDGLYREIQEEILRNPVYGDMVARGLVYDANWFSDNVLWLNEFIEKSDEFYAMESNPEVSVRVEKWLMVLVDEPDKYYVNVEYRMYAEKICQLLDEFTNLGVHSYTSDGYWALSLSSGSYTRTLFREGTELKVEALILCKKATNGTNISILGFDLRDKGLLHYKHSVID